MIKEKKIKELNDYFKSLTKEEKKVAIAKDVLLQLKNKKYVAKTGDYVDFDYWETISAVDYDLNIQQHFDVIKNCKVCALGSAALSCIKYSNNSSFEDARRNTNKFWNQLLKVFTKKELVIIEYAFEGFAHKACGRSVNWNIDISDNILNKTCNFYYKHSNNDNRLKAIMKNIIKNEGKFVL